MNQAQQNAIRTLAKQAIEAHREAEKSLGRSPSPQEVKSIWSPYREKASILTNGECCLISFNIIIRNVARGL